MHKLDNFIHALVTKLSNVLEIQLKDELTQNCIV